VPAAVMGDAAIAVGRQVDHLALPRIGVDRPAMAEDDGSVVLDRGSCSVASDVVYAAVGLDACCGPGRSARLPRHFAGFIAAYRLPRVWMESSRGANSVNPEASRETPYAPLAVRAVPFGAPLSPRKIAGDSVQW
jgi:hypothetical protein